MKRDAIEQTMAKNGKKIRLLVRNKKNELPKISVTRIQTDNLSIMKLLPTLILWIKDCGIQYYH